MARLLDGAAPTLLATDPPYGVQLDQTWRDGVYNGPRKRVKGWGVVAGAEYLGAQVARLRARGALQLATELSEATA